MCVKQISALLFYKGKALVFYQSNFLLNICNAPYFVHNSMCKLVGLLARRSLAVNADDGFGVRLAQMHPTLRKINLHAVLVVYFELFVAAFYHAQHAVHIDGGRQLYLVFRDKVVRVRLAQFGYGFARFGQVREEQGNAHERIASVVRGGVDDTAVAFAANHGVGGFHFGHHVHLTHGGGVVLAAVFCGYVAQRAGRTQI